MCKLNTDVPSTQRSGSTKYWMKSAPVWPDLAKIRHYGKIIQAFGYIFRVGYYVTTFWIYFGKFLWPNVHGWKGQILKHWSRWSARKWKMSELPDSFGLALPLAIEILLINKFESSIRDFFFSAVIRFCFEWKLMEKERDKWKKKERRQLLILYHEWS